MKKNQIKNLKKLAKYLYNLPDDYSHFDMGTYCEDDCCSYEVTEVSKETYSECGTVACALGHGIAAGIKPYNNVGNWNNYSKLNFGLDFWEGNYWDWCFTDSWVGYDNTPKGAAKRIMYMLERGVPKHFDEDFEKSLEVYKDYVPVFED